ncbi:hypothetical protein PV10_08950 [Exophiala mesophila]|uniref:Sec39 domain-containing protein n=1 Tax=Exophiala mesophila TaxID=212818 RepID=A0A0D1Z3M3_EXOME|nr:uncharacterized protein PV10_08950 [Exophiala mesophila]KIV89377.1 hypothetical protein PV10_08950 [Exophiala mesophila]
MSDLNKLSDAHILLLAAQLASAAELEDLLLLQHQHTEILPITLIYRLVLSFYPTNDSVQARLASFLKRLHSHDLPPSKHGKAISIDPFISATSDHEAVRRCRILKLVPLPQEPILATDNNLANFVVTWSHHLASIGSTPAVLNFVECFLDLDPVLTSWYQSCLTPHARLEYELYPESTDMLLLSDVETLSGRDGISQLLKFARNAHSSPLLKRDLDEVVTPWVQGSGNWKRRKIEQPSANSEYASWNNVNDWFVSASVDDFATVASAFVEWDGPPANLTGADSNPKSLPQVVLRLLQTGIAMVYASSKISPEVTAGARNVLRKVATKCDFQIFDIASPDSNSRLPATFTESLKESHLLLTALLTPGNPLTTPSISSLQLLQHLLDTADLMLDFELPVTITDLSRLCVFGTERQQREKFRQMMQRIALKQPTDWATAKARLLKAHDWRMSSQTEQGHNPLGIFSHLSPRFMDMQLLVAALEHGRYDVVKELYIDNSMPYLTVEDVESTIAAAILKSYDNASDGNRDSGGLRSAYDMLRTFRPHFPKSATLQDIDQLIKATHRLSFYRLDLLHGVPFRPVAIRVQKNPLNLIAKVLEQDHRAYTKLDDLLEIGRSLVHAHLPSRASLQDSLEPVQIRLIEAEHEITRLAIEAALSADDFNTAYSYITTRFSNSTLPEYSDDTSWRAAFAAGKYRPSTSPKNLEARIENLAQRMELLSRALILAPVGECLAEILGTWRRHEEEMIALREEGVLEERAADARADGEIPGSFGLDDRELDAAESKQTMARRGWPGAAPGISYEEHAPMGLFDVAKGAATALRKSSFFPIGTGGLQNLNIRDNSAPLPQPYGLDQQGDHTAIGERVRKRDTVTNAFVSGMGWVLGAQPQDRTDTRASNG